MGSSVISDKRIRWLTVDSTADAKIQKSSWGNNLKTAKKIKRRTKALNKELRKFGQLQSYHQYVKIKTSILRDITSNEDTDDDTDTYSVQKGDSQESLLSPTLKNYVSTGSNNLGDSHNIKDTNMHGKQNKKSRQVNELKSSSSDRLSSSNTPKNKEESINKVDTASRKRVLCSSGNKDSKHKKSLMSVKKNLLFELENLSNDNSVYTIERTCPIAESTQIHNEDSNDNVHDDMQSYEIVNNESVPNREFQNSAKDNLSHDINILDRSIALVTNKVTSDGDAEYVEEATQKLEQKLEQEESAKEETKHEQEQLQIQEQSSLNGAIAKRSQPVITSTTIVKEKYTIVWEGNDAHPTINADNDSSFTEELAIEKASFSPEIESLTDEETSEENELSPESLRVRQLKRINLMSDSSDSSDSQGGKEDRKEYRVNTKNNVTSPSSTHIDDSEESNESNIGFKKCLPSSSQVISDPSDSDEANDNPDETMNEEELPSSANNQRSSLSLSISESKPGACTVSQKVDCVSENTSPGKTTIGSANKSIKCQIRAQENVQPSSVLKKIHEPEVVEKTKKKRKKRNLEANNVNPATNDGSHKTNSSRDELKNGTCRADAMKNSSETCNIKNDEEKRSQREGSHDHSEQRFGAESSRPVELRDFIDGEGLVATTEISTVTAKDLNKCAQENGDEEIWLMELPRSIMTDGNTLCGKKMSFKKGKMIINDTTYKTSCTDITSVPCILSSGRKKARYKTVNLKPVGCIIVRQQTSDRMATSVSQFPTTQLSVQTDAARSTVPFPKNLKSRDPLLSLSSTGGISHLSTTKNNTEVLKLKKKLKKKRKLDHSNECQ